MTGWKRAAVLAACVLTSATVWAANEPAAGQTNWDKFKAYSHKEKDKAVAAGKQLIADTDKKIAAMGKDVKNANAETKKAHEANMKELKEKKKAAQDQLAKMGKATGEAWDATKEGFANAGKELHASYEKAAAAIKK